MFKNYFLVAWRNIIRHKFYATLNILGLATGISFTFLIVAYIWSESQVNHDLKNADRQYILQSKWKNPEMGMEMTSPGQLAKALKDNNPGLVENYYRWDGIGSNVSVGNQAFREGLQVGDSTLLNMYGFEPLYGDKAAVFNEPFSVVITADKAKKYFGKEDVVGRALTIESFSGTKHDFIVTGVIATPSKNSVTSLTNAIKNEIFIAGKDLAFFSRNMLWNNPIIVSYIELKPGIKPEQLKLPLEKLMKQQAPPGMAEQMQPYLVPLKLYYLDADNGLVKKMLFTLGIIALFIMLMAVINFINLSVSRSSARMREIGVRKVMGGLRRDLIVQFLLESIVTLFFATVVAIIIYFLSRGLFSEMLGRPVPFLNKLPLFFLIFIPLIIIILIGVGAGFYPAFVLSSLKAAESIKGKLTNANERLLWRRALLGFQFATAFIVLIGAVVIAQQVNYFLKKDLGFNKDYVLFASLPRDWSMTGLDRVEEYRKQLAALPDVSEAAISWEVPNGNGSGGVSLYLPGDDSSKAVVSQLITSDEHYAATLNIPMLAGDFFSKPGFLTDTQRIVINERQARALGFKNPGEALGKEYRMTGRNESFRISGVTKDFHVTSLHTAIPPVTFMHVGKTNFYRYVVMKIKPGSISSSIEKIQRKWSQLMPGTPFEFTFIDESLRNLYKTEYQLKQASLTATILSVIIVLLGIVGLVSLHIEKRTREIGIRKVLGSSIGAILGLFVKEFVYIMLIAAVIACPVAYLLLNGWLDHYVYRINITAYPFIKSVSILAAITILLICLQTYHTAAANPVKSLRSE